LRILLVEKTRSVVTSHIGDDRFLVTCAEDADEAMSLLQHESYDLVLLSMGEQSTDGFDLIRRLRASGNDTPVLALTGSRLDGKIEALRLGADEALAEPIDPAELRARITSVLRHRREVGQPLLRVGDLSLCLTTNTVRFGDRLVQLSPKEFAMLELMVRRKGTILTKATFLNHLHNGADDEPDARIIDVFICKLRKKLERAGAGDVISIVWGHGYMLRDLDVMARSTADFAPSVIRLDLGNRGDLRPIQARRDFSFNMSTRQAS
jgi:two-component system, cell cycle response regulator CtrA